MKIEDFLKERFGMFIHWGVYSIPGRGEWLRSHAKMSIEEYQKYVDEFNPSDYNPKEWAKLAKKAGMKYAVMTAKHHDGYCLFDSKYTDYSSQHYIGRDLIREYVDAFRSEGIKVGLYYSVIDWHHEDYPTYGDLQHPMRDNEAYKDLEKDKNLDNYLDYMHGQVRELMTNYGEIDILWFDFSYNNTPESGLPRMKGETWRATELVKMIKELQPNIVINNRLGGDMRLDEPEYYAGDFTSPEQIIPAKGMLNNKGEVLPWEACVTLNSSWGYSAKNSEYKSVKTIIRTIVECVSKNGNLLLNVGPNSKGQIPKESVEILEEVGKWMDANSKSIYNCKAADYERPEWGRYTQNGKFLYAHILDRGIGWITLLGLEGKVKKARMLHDGAEVLLDRPWNVSKFPDDAFLILPSQELPDENDTVIEIELI